jgi:hypothetical protein
VLRAAENESLTRVGPGTLMGNLLRRYWTPACLSAEIPQPGSPPARVTARVTACALPGSVVAGRTGGLRDRLARACAGAWRAAGWAAERHDD